MKELKPDKNLLVIDIKERKKKQAEEKIKENKKEAWKESYYYKMVIDILDEEIEKANNNSAIPAGLSTEERGQYSLALVIAYQRLLKIKNRLT